MAETPIFWAVLTIALCICEGFGPNSPGQWLDRPELLLSVFCCHECLLSDFYSHELLFSVFWCPELLLPVPIAVMNPYFFLITDAVMNSPCLYLRCSELLLTVPLLSCIPTVLFVLWWAPIVCTYAVMNFLSVPVLELLLSVCSCAEQTTYFFMLLTKAQAFSTCAGQTSHCLRQQ